MGFLGSFLSLTFHHTHPPSPHTHHCAAATGLLCPGRGGVLTGGPRTFLLDMLHAGPLLMLLLSCREEDSMAVSECRCVSVCPIPVCVGVCALLCLWVPAQQKPPLQLSAQAILQMSSGDCLRGPHNFVARGTAAPTPGGSGAPFVLAVAPFALPLCPETLQMASSSTGDRAQCRSPWPWMAPRSPLLKGPPVLA